MYQWVDRLVVNVFEKKKKKKKRLGRTGLDCLLYVGPSCLSRLSDVGGRKKHGHSNLSADTAARTGAGFELDL